MAVGAALLGSGCDARHAVLLDPKGPIALAQRDLLFDAFCVMLIVVIPVFVMAFLFARRYRASNTKAAYTPNWSYSGRIDAVVWLIPAVIVVALGTLLWRTTHKLDPYRPIDTAVAPLEVQVVAQEWKWLFIYPEQGIAVVNQLAFPSGRPLSLRITSDTAMSSFYIPALGGQIYAMAGMETRLHLLADAPGTFTGRNTQDRRLMSRAVFQGHRDDAGGIRCLGGQGPPGAGQARCRDLPGAGGAQHGPSRDLLFRLRAEPVPIDHREIRHAPGARRPYVARQPTPEFSQCSVS